jgi:hypothetical protein
LDWIWLASWKQWERASTVKLAPRLDPRRYTLDTIGDAYPAIKDGSAQGKLVVDILPPAVPGTS